MDPGRRPLVLLALAAMALAVEVAWLAPAALLDSRIANATGGALRLAGARGTLWQGEGVVIAATRRIPVAWDVDLWPLLRGVIHMRVSPANGAESPRGIVDLRADGITLRDTTLSVPAATIKGVLGDTTPGSIEGDIEATAGSLNLTPGSNTGEAQIVWRNARVSGVGRTPLDLGVVRATLVANGATMSGPLTNDGGSLALRGEWAVKEKDAFTLALRLTPRRSGDVELARWLSASGVPDGDGWRIDWRLPLR